MVSVAYDVTDANLYVKDEYPRYIVPLRVIPGSKLKKLIRVMENISTIPFNEIRDHFLSGAIFDNGEFDSSTLPTKGEKVIATFEEKDSELLCTHLKLIDREELYYVNLSKVSNFYKSVERFLDE